jgi:hypothetical protein
VVGHCSGDKAYEIAAFVASCRELKITAHVAQNKINRRSAIDARTTRHAGHQISQRIRKRIEEPFGWIKTVGGGRKLRYKDRRRNRAWFMIAGAVYNVLRIASPRCLTWVNSPSEPAAPQRIEPPDWG